MFRAKRISGRFFSWVADNEEILKDLRARHGYSKYNGVKISDITCSILKEHNIKNTFIYNGGAIMSIIYGLYRNKVPYYVNSNEFCVGSSAVGYAKALRTTGVAIVTS